LWPWIGKWTSTRIPVHIRLLLLAAELLALWLKARLWRHQAIRKRGKVRTLLRKSSRLRL